MKLKRLVRLTVDDITNNLIINNVENRLKLRRCNNSNTGKLDNCRRSGRVCSNDNNINNKNRINDNTVNLNISLSRQRRR